MTIYFLRHASAGERKKDPRKDAKRGLDRTGVDQAVRSGRTLAALEAHLDAIVTSPLKRASQTAALVANEMGYESKLVLDDALLPQATYAAFQQLLAKNAAHDAILLVGHNPSLPQFLGRLIASAGRPARLQLRKAGLAKVESAQPGATLHWLLSPKTEKATPSKSAAKAAAKAGSKS